MLRGVFGASFYLFLLILFLHYWNFCQTLENSDFGEFQIVHVWIIGLSLYVLFIKVLLLAEFSVPS